MKKNISFLFILLFTTFSQAQQKKSSKMGQATLEELKMTVYDKDSTAGAVVLYEHANVYLDTKNDNNTRTDFYYRIKILDKSKFDLADITINLYKKKQIKDLKAITYNLIGNRIVKNHLLQGSIFTTKENENWTTKKITLTNIKEGSVIEYKYSILSPYLGISDWYFQSDIPKIKSEFDAAILGNYEYNVRIIGLLNLDKDKPSVKKKCVYLDGLGYGACAVYSYGMNNIPAFKEEDYMLSKKNYLARLSFDLKSFTSAKGVVNRYTTTWKEADKKLKKQFFNNQISKKSYFKNRIPENILNIQSNLERAKSIFTFIQNNFTWNNKYWSNEDAKVKEAFKNRSGSVSEINLSLYNSLRAANIEPNLVVLSTRENGFSTKLYPIIYDYNYVIVKITIEGKDYYLDATDKFLPFGQLPIRTLNGEARVINFDKEGDWDRLKPSIKSSKSTVANLKIDNNGDISGSLITRRSGYNASKRRKEIALLTDEKYIDLFETEHPNFEVEDFKIISKNEIEKPLQEIISLKIPAEEELRTKIKINPFLIDKFKENPFKLKERNYPVDFAYSRKNYYTLSLKVPEEFTVSQLPKNIGISLPNNGGSFIIKALNKNNTITLFVRFNINKNVYTSEEYFELKEFFKQIIIAESSYIVLEKTIKQQY